MDTYVLAQVCALTPLRGHTQRSLSPCPGRVSWDWTPTPGFNAQHLPQATVTSCACRLHLVDDVCVSDMKTGHRTSCRLLLRSPK